jgi:hypothetical protein
MFRIVFSKAIWTHEESLVHEQTGPKAFVLGPDSDKPVPKVALLRKELALPFPPYIGLSISAEGWSCKPLQMIEWCNTAQLFRCTVPDEFPCWALDTYLHTRIFSL